MGVVTTQIMIDRIKKLKTEIDESEINKNKKRYKINQELQEENHNSWKYNEWKIYKTRDVRCEKDKDNGLGIIYEKRKKNITALSMTTWNGGKSK